MKTKEFLTDLETQKIELFCKDKEMKEAVRKVLLAGIYSHGTIKKDGAFDPLENSAYHLAALAVTNPIPDEEIGANVRAMFAGLNAMKNAFDELESIKMVKEVTLEEVNEAI